MRIRKILLALSLILYAGTGFAQQPKPGWLLEAVEARARDAQSAAAIASEGRQLYDVDPNKLSWADYCRSSQQLAFRGEFREAVRAASKAFFLGKGEGSSDAQGAAARDLALAFHLAGDLQKAWYWAEQGMAFAEGARYGRSSILSAIHGIRGNIELQRGAHERAIAEYRNALSHIDRPNRPFVLVRLARAEHKRGNTSKASEIYADLRGDDNRFIRSTVLRGEAEIALDSGQAEAAKRLYSEAVKTVNEVETPLTAMWFRFGLARATLAIGDRKAAIAELENAVRQAESLRAVFRSEEFRSGFFSNVQEIYELAIELAMDEGLFAEAFDLTEMSRARAFADLIRGRINHPGARPEQPVNAASIAEVLPPKTALVLYHVFPKRTAAWVVRGGAKITGLWLPIGEAQLAESTRLLRKRIQELAPALNEASLLYAQLIEPLKLQEDESVVFVPHKSLHFLPFAALRGPKGWMIEERAIATAPSASALATIVRKSSIPSSSLLALGNPSLPKGDLPPLPGAEIEVERIAPQFASASKYVREAATKVRLLTDGPSNTVLHVAAHAQVDEIDPMYSRVRLAASGQGSADLEAHELYRVNLGEVRLVTLSACDSGLGRVSGGDEFWGFKRTVLGAGARTLLASLWPVVDESTPILMARFYESLKKTSGAEALRASQLELIHSKQYAHPIFWAPFALVGDWR